MNLLRHFALFKISTKIALSFEIYKALFVIIGNGRLFFCVSYKYREEKIEKKNTASLPNKVKRLYCIKIMSDFSQGPILCWVDRLIDIRSSLLSRYLPNLWLYCASFHSRSCLERIYHDCYS